MATLRSGRLGRVMCSLGLHNDRRWLGFDCADMVVVGRRCRRCDRKKGAMWGT